MGPSSTWLRETVLSFAKAAEAALTTSRIILFVFGFEIFARANNA